MAIVQIGIGPHAHAGLGTKMIHKNDLRNLIISTLKSVGLHSDDATELLMGTSAQETHLGQMGLVQRGGGPALGIFQCERTTERWLWDFLSRRADLCERIISTSGVSGPSELHLRGNLVYQILMARVKYLTYPEPLPDSKDILGMARYWKKYYNSILGRGKVREFVKNYNRFVR